MIEPPSTRLSLIRRLGDPSDGSAWNTFVEQYAPLLYRYARVKGLQDADASDLVQEVFEAVAKHVNRFEPRFQKTSFRRWFFRIAYTKLCDQAQRRNRQPKVLGDLTASIAGELSGGLEDNSSWLEIERRRELFERAAKQIQPTFQEKTWQAFWNTAVEGQDAQQVAEGLGMSIGAVYIAKSRVTSKLRTLINDWEKS